MRLAIKGKKKIQGTVAISGSKNSAVAIIPASILCDEDVTLRNVPNIEDVRCLITILTSQGFIVKYLNNILTITKGEKIKKVFLEDFSNRLRGSCYFLGAYLGKYHKIKMKAIGGCNLGERPINYHLESFKKMKAKCKVADNSICLKTRGLVGCDITFDYPSVGSTINTIIAACKAKGKTIINNAAMEPEVSDVCDFLNSMGANIIGIGTSTITITGVKYLHKTDYTISFDRIEAGTYLILGSLMEGSKLTVTGINPLHLISPLKVLEECGVNVRITKNYVTVERTGQLQPIHIQTAPYPGFPTDLGPIISILMLQTNGVSTLKETVFQNRFSHVSEICKMGGKMELNGNTLTVSPSKLKASSIKAYDLRGAASLVVAACSVKSLTLIDNIDVLFRGYENPLEKLMKLGINVEVENSK